MTVSIILPTYNEESHIKKTIESILKQSYQDFELIIINNGSTDSTDELLNSISDSRVKVITQDHQSIASSVNNGFSHATGKYWTSTSANHAYTPNWLAEMVSALETHSEDVGCALSYHAVTDQKGNIVFINNEQRFDLPTLLFDMNHIESYLCRSELMKKVGGYDTLLSYAEKEDMWVRLASSTPAILVKKVLCYHRMNENKTDDTEIDSDLLSESYKTVVDKFLLRTRGRFVIDYLFPSIGLSKNPEFERFKARLRIATLAFHTKRYCPVDSIVDLLMQALEQSYDEKLIVNILYFYSNHDRWEDAKLIVDSYLKSNPSRFLESLNRIVNAKDKPAIQKLSFLTMDESYLANDCVSQRTQKEILRHFVSSETKSIEDNTGFLAQIVTELVNGLDDGKDHPEIWHALSEFKSEKDRLRLSQLKAYISALLSVPQDQKVSNYLKVLEAVCYTYTNNPEAGKAKLQTLLKELPDLASAKGALSFITS